MHKWSYPKKGLLLDKIQHVEVAKVKSSNFGQPKYMSIDPIANTCMNGSA